MIQPKFRGLSKETNKWTYGFGWYETDYTDEYLEELGQTKQDAILFTDGIPIVCNIDSMSQYTGLKDRNGKEIYEGDILTSDQYPFQDEGKYNYHGVIEWIDELASFYMTKRLANSEKRGISDGISEQMEDIEVFEVIGNIYENPELLNA